MKSQPYFLTGTLQQSLADQIRESQGIPFGLLKCVNAYTSRRKGAAVKRGGSLTETIAGTLNTPLGLGVYEAGDSAALMPIEAKYLAAFSGGNFRLKDSGVWSTVTCNANVSFSNTKPFQFAQIGTMLAIAGKKPARYYDGASEIEMMGYPAPGGTITFATSAGALSPLIGYKWMYTFYNSTTGQESDWSALSASSGAQTSKQFDLTIPTTAPGSSADKKRIYRTQDGGSTYYLVTEIVIATGSYTDNTADTALGAQAEDQYVRGLPPSESYIVEKYAGRFWYVNAANAYQLCPSQPYTGNVNSLLYYDEGERLTCDHPITGLCASSAGMLIFGVRHISILTGKSLATFRIDDYRPGVGTLFPNSIAKNGSETVFLGEGRYYAVQNGRVRDISDPIQEDLRVLLEGTYNQWIYASSCWNPVLQQFIFAFSASSDAGTPWELSSSGSIALWELSSSSALESWEIPGAPAVQQATTRVKIWGWNPTRDEWCEYKFGQLSDNNAVGAFISYVVTPLPSSDTLDPQQEITFLGAHCGANAAKVIGAFRADRAKDDSTVVSAIVITDRIQPGRPDGRERRFRSLIFDGTYQDLSARGGEITYIKDADDPHLSDYSSNLKTFQENGDMKIFKDGLARHVHLIFEDETDNTDVIMAQAFTVNYVDKSNRQTR